MAATLFYLSKILWICFLFLSLRASYYNVISDIHNKLTGRDIKSKNWFVQDDLFDLKVLHKRINRWSCSNKDNGSYPRRPISAWHKHGFVCIHLPEKDLTTCGDIHSNPGPILPQISNSILSNFSGNRLHAANSDLHISCRKQSALPKPDTRSQLLNIWQIGRCNFSSAVLPNILNHHRVYSSYRGKRGGKSKISTRITTNQRFCNFFHMNINKAKCKSNKNNLIVLPCNQLPKSDVRTSYVSPTTAVFTTVHDSQATFESDPIITSSLQEQSPNDLHTENQDLLNIPVSISLSRETLNRNSLLPRSNRNNLIHIKCQRLVDKSVQHPIRFGVLNARSVRNKALFVKDYLVDQQIDIMALTETWLSQNGDEHVIEELCPNGFVFKHVPRSEWGEDTGGGVGLLYNRSIKLQQRPVQNFNSFEIIDFDLSMAVTNTKLRILVIYRPPPSINNELTVNMFLNDFSDLLEQTVVSCGKLLITGDFNFHVDVATNTSASRFLDLLDTFDLQQHITEPTHKDGHTLDLIITRKGETLTSNYVVRDPGISDHAALRCDLSIIKPPNTKRRIEYRKLTSIDFDKFCQDVSDSELLSKSYDDINDAIKNYEQVLTSILDVHAPLKSRVVTVRPSSQWYTDEIKEEKTRRRVLERRWRKSQLFTDKELYLKQCRRVNNMIFETKMNFYSSVINENQFDQRELFRNVNKVLNRTPSVNYPSCSSTQVLVDNFADFFTSKIEKIRESLPVIDSSSDIQDSHRCSSELSDFTPVTSEDLATLVKPLSGKSCILDPIPAYVLKKCFDLLLPVIRKIINMSLMNSCVPEKMKVGALVPLLKKMSLDFEIYPNFRPVSNLMFLSKATEKVAASQLLDYLESNGYHEVYQSAYKLYHSTETALLRVMNDVLRAVDNKETVILLLLDLSAAFDTVDHEILLSRLSSRFGITGSVLEWFRSYLSNRHQFVYINGTKSSDRQVKSGVPQGSVLGPILFLMYMAPLGDLLRQHGMNHHSFADDTQLYASFHQGNEDQLNHAIYRTKTCVVALEQWMFANKLKLNKEKTELIVLSSKFREEPNVKSLDIGGEIIHSSNYVRNIGVLFDKHLTMAEHVSFVCKCSFYQLRRIAKIRKYLSLESAKTLIHAFVTSRLDHCNALLYGIDNNLLQKLQYIQNSAARLLTRTRKYDHITPVLKELHWLPVEKRIMFKLLLITFKALKNFAPSYICDLITRYKPARVLRSCNKNLLKVPRSRTKTYGDRAFSFAAPALWNTLPAQVTSSVTIREFKRNLKTYLFNLCFS